MLLGSAKRAAVLGFSAPETATRPLRKTASCSKKRPIGPLAHVPRSRRPDTARTLTPRKIFRRDVRSASISTPMEVMGNTAATRLSANLSILNQGLCIVTAWLLRMKRPRALDVDLRASEDSFPCARLSSQSITSLSTRRRPKRSGWTSVTTASWSSPKPTISLCPTTSPKRSRMRVKSANSRNAAQVRSLSSTSMFKEVGLWHVAPRTRKVSRSANRETFEECGSNLAVAGDRFEVLS